MRRAVVPAQDHLLWLRVFSLCSRYRIWTDLPILKSSLPRGVNDCSPLIQKYAVAWSIVHFSAAEIDDSGIQHANIEGMRRAVAQLAISPGYVLTDGFSVPGLPMPSLPVIKGDANVLCIAAASVLAKVSRDHIMVQYADEYPEYGFERHKGYATASHQAAMEHYGVSPIHRMSYANVMKAHAIAGMRKAAPVKEE